MNRAASVRSGVFFVLLLIFALAFALATASPAQAKNIRVACDPVGTFTVDPIRPDSGHTHIFGGNTLTPFNEETYDDLYNHKESSCNATWYTNHVWNPVVQDEPQQKFDVYYNKFKAPHVNAIPEGLELLASDVTYACGGSPGDPAVQQDTPPYGCTQNWGTYYHFPRCYDGSGVLTPEHTVYGPNKTDCPADHPYVLPEVYYIAIHKNFDGVVPRPLEISCGIDQWCDYTHDHADYIFAAQDEFNHAVDLNGNGVIERNFDTVKEGLYSEAALFNLCINWSPDSLEYNNERCRPGGLSPAQQRAIDNYNASL